MIYFDANGFPTDKTGDGGDSAMRFGMLASFGYQSKVSALFYEWDVLHGDGWIMRHPLQRPWDNKLNVSRDQLIPFSTGASKRGSHDLCRRIFHAAARRAFFAQNFQRDYEGSWKYPWPHAFIGEHGLPETRNFDFADPLLPDHIFHLILCARLYSFYWFSIIGIPWFIASLYFHSKSSHKEHNQVICQCLVLGPWALKLFKKLIPNWKQDLFDYWGSRDEKEYAEMIISGIDAMTEKKTLKSILI